MHRNLRKFIAILSFIFLIAVSPLFPRAGGSGGGHGHFSGGHSHSGGGHFGSFGSHTGSFSGGRNSGPLEFNAVSIIFMLFFFGIPLFVIIMILIVAFKPKKTGFKSISAVMPEKLEDVPGYNEFIESNPDFNAEEFQKKVKSAFVEIQEAWSKGNIGASRRFMTDGVYQRFSSQLQMMGLLKQKDIITDIDVSSVNIICAEIDGQYDIIHTMIEAEMDDQFVSETDHSLDSPGDTDDFTEVWSFIRKRGKGGKDIFSSNNCPQCSAPLPENLGDAGQCPYCKTFINNAEYDWVLSEISQTDDYHLSAGKSDKSEGLFDSAYEMHKDNPDFCIQLLEDKVSNGYLQIQTAMAFHDPQWFRRFVSDELFEKLKVRLPSENIVYNRLYLNDVSLMAIRQTENTNIMYVGVKSTFQRVILENGMARLKDHVLMTDFEVVRIERGRLAGISKGSVYAHLCPGCGAPVSDSLELKCAYCGTLLNSSVHEWIITDILAREDYDSHIKDVQPQIGAKIPSGLDDSLYEVRDYAFNNMMVIFGADGIFADEEKAMAEGLAKKWGYKKEFIARIVEAAMSGRLSIRMPSDKIKTRKILELMNKAAMADGKIDPAEKQILDQITKQYL